MSLNPLVSIVVPAYNVDNYIARCLKSIQEQTYKNFEVLIVDDGSTDNTLKTIKTFCSKDNRFSWFHKENGGQMSAYLLALKHIKGEYIGFVDPDDYIEKSFYDKLLKRALAYCCDIVVSGFNYYDAETKEYLYSSKNEEKFYDESNVMNLWKHVLPRPNSPSVSMSRVNKLFKKEIILNNIKYCEMDISRVMEDRRLVPACLWGSKRIMFTDYCLYNVSVNRTGSTSGKYIEELTNIIFKIHNIHKTALMDYGIFDECIDEYEESILDFIRIYVKRNILNVDNKKIKKQSCKELVHEKRFRDAILRYSKKLDKLLFITKLSIKFKSWRLLYFSLKFYKNKIRNI